MSARVVQHPCILFLLLAAALLPAADSRYTLKEGETLFSVARRAQVPVDILGTYNGIADAARVKTGTVLRIPAAYTVKKGDTLYGIARAFGLPVGKLLDLNRLSQSSRLKVGERIFVPRDADQGVGRTAEAAQRTSRSEPLLATDAVSPQPGNVVVWPHTGRHEMDNGKMPGLIFYGAAGDVVRSATAGEVKWAATYWTRGKVVIIKSVDGTLCTYGGNAELLVNVGDRVSPGTDIGKLGESPQGGGAKLYFSISDGSGHVVDPEKYFSAKSQS